MTRFAMAVLAALLAPLAAMAQADGENSARIVAALNQNRIAITAGFEGSEIFVYGAIAHEGPLSFDDATELGVVINVIGPSEPLIVRRRDRRYGIWVNVESAEIDLAPSYYAVASTRQFYDTIGRTEDLRHRVSLDHALRFVGAPEGLSDREAFLAAVVRLRREAGVYQLRPGGVEMIEDALFRTTFNLPANITEGVYRARVFLTRNREVVDVFETDIDVRKAGLERFLYDLSKNQPLLYGLLSIFVAVAAGLSASEVFRYLRR